MFYSLQSSVTVLYLYIFGVQDDDGGGGVCVCVCVHAFSICTLPIYTHFECCTFAFFALASLILSVSLSVLAFIAW